MLIVCWHYSNFMLDLNNYLEAENYGLQLGLNLFCCDSIMFSVTRKTPSYYSTEWTVLFGILSILCKNVLATMCNIAFS